jgi:hypothetical protein
MHVIAHAEIDHTRPPCGLRLLEDIAHPIQHAGCEGGFIPDIAGLYEDDIRVRRYPLSPCCDAGHMGSMRIIRESLLIDASALKPYLILDILPVPLGAIVEPCRGSAVHDLLAPDAQNARALPIGAFPEFEMIDIDPGVDHPD